MSERTAVYRVKREPTNSSGIYKISRIANAPLKGPEAMLEASTLCPEEVQVGWYYNENTNTFLSPEQYETPQDAGHFIMPPPKYEADRNPSHEPQERIFGTENLGTSDDIKL